MFKVLCIKSHSLNHVIEGREYNVLKMITCTCGCSKYVISELLYKISTCDTSHCVRCGRLSKFQAQYSTELFTRNVYQNSAIKSLVNIKHITETSNQPMTNPSPMKPMKELINN